MEYIGNAPAGVWVKSARSGQGANCLEFMFLSDRVLIRDSKDPDGAQLSVSRKAFMAFRAMTQEQVLPDQHEDRGYRCVAAVSRYR